MIGQRKSSAGEANRIFISIQFLESSWTRNDVNLSFSCGEDSIMLIFITLSATPNQLIMDLLMATGPPIRNFEALHRTVTSLPSPFLAYAREFEILLLEFAPGAMDI